MLRILVISLFVANLLLFGFQGSKPATETKPVVKRSVIEDASIPTIHLFSELARDQDLLNDNRQCFSLGPFHSVGDMDDTRARLLEVSSVISERQTEALVEKGYWVFMPPYTSLLEANRELFSLQALGLEDISIIYEGDWMNAISLGYFMRQENALRRKKNLEDRGFAPQIRVQRQAEPRYWLDYEQAPGSALIALDMRNRPNDFMQRSLPCPQQGLSEITLEAERVPVDEPITTPDADSESLPADDVESRAEDTDEVVSDQDTETEPGTADGTETGEAQDSRSKTLR